MNTQHKGNILWWVVGIIAVGIGAFFLFRSHTPQYQAPQTPAGEVNGDSTAAKLVLEGTVVCLPHRTTTGPTTLECAYGLKTDDGKYYGLDTSNLPSTQPPEYQVGDRLSVEGALKPQASITGNFLQIYNVEGVVAMDAFWKFVDK